MNISLTRFSILFRMSFYKQKVVLGEALISSSMTACASFICMLTISGWSEILNLDNSNVQFEIVSCHMFQNVGMHNYVHYMLYHFYGCKIVD